MLGESGIGAGFQPNKCRTTVLSLPSGNPGPGLGTSKSATQRPAAQSGLERQLYA